MRAIKTIDRKSTAKQVWVFNHLKSYKSYYNKNLLSILIIEF